jgi:hypothetical protein
MIAARRRFDGGGRHCRAWPRGAARDVGCDERSDHANLYRSSDWASAGAHSPNHTRGVARPRDHRFTSR